MNIGHQIKALRLRRGVTQEEVAQHFGITAQAVSKWERGGSYPDINLLPSIANYFGITLDELFGYVGSRTRRVDALIERVDEMIMGQYVGEEIDLDECIALARAGMIEFPGNERIMVCLASVLYKAGYWRYGEFHLTDEEGYSVYDAQRHLGYAEWAEAVKLYEKALQTLPEGELRRQAKEDLTQLYLNIGEREKALALAESAPEVYRSREFLKVYACDGKQQAEACGEGLLKIIRAGAVLMVLGTLAHGRNMTPGEKAQSILGAIGLFEQVCTDGNFGEHGAFVAKLYTQRAVYLWLDGRHDEAFEALDNALVQFRRFEKITGAENASYTAPLIRLTRVEPEGCCGLIHGAVSLAEDLPWWDVPEGERVKSEMQADPRWELWMSELLQG